MTGDSVLNEQLDCASGKGPHCWHQYKIGIGVQVDPIPSRCCECDDVTGEDLWKGMDYMPKPVLNQEYTDAGA